MTTGRINQVFPPHQLCALSPSKCNNKRSVPVVIAREKRKVVSSRSHTRWITKQQLFILRAPLNCNKNVAKEAAYNMDGSFTHSLCFGPTTEESSHFYCRRPTSFFYPLQTFIVAKQTIRPTAMKLSHHECRNAGCQIRDASNRSAKVKP